MSLPRLLLAGILAVVSATGMAASVAERSPFTQGIWWDSTRSGNGFDVFNVGTDVSILWYTYDASGQPIWYSAQGSFNGVATETLTLYEHRWVDGKHSPAPTSVGTIRLQVKHAERMVATWTLGTQSGAWNITPFVTAGTVPEVDHTGTWFDPRAPGWGLSLLEQGDVTGAIVYTYDASGRPTWLAGFGRDRNSVELFTYTGACPSCTYAPSAARTTGRLGYDFDQEWRLTLHGTPASAMASGINIEGTPVFQLSRPASTRPADRQLASFPNEATLKDYLVAGYGNIFVPSPGGFSASPPATSSSASTFSTTNLQESGVDEADLVKSDGRYIYTFAEDNGTRKPVIRIAQVPPGGSSLAVRGTYSLTSGASTPMRSAGLYLSGNTLVSVTGTQPTYPLGLPVAWSATGSWSGGAMTIEVMSLLAPDIPSTRWRAEIEGNVVTSRRIGDRLYVVSRFVPALGLDPQAQPAANLLPKIRVNGAEPQPLLEPAAIYSPPQGDRAVVADLIVVTAIDLAQPRVAQSLAIVGTPDAVYASPQGLYVATTRSAYRLATGTLLTVEPAFTTTDIHLVRLDAAAMTIVGSGTVEGYLGENLDKAAFRMGEYGAQLRVVTGSRVMWGRSGMNRLTILEPSRVMPGLLRVISTLPNAQRPDPLGKSDEQLYGTRFVDERLYAVTFKKVDPLYVVDLSNPADPRIAGQVELPGFSEYLHPLSPGLLLGFGKDACPTTVMGDGQFAWYQGLQLNLFDVSNASQPKVVQSLTMGRRGSTSALLTDHHAFSALTLPDGTTSIAIPGRIHDGTSVGTCDSTSYAWKESGLLRFEVRGTQLVQRPSLVTHTPLTAPSMNMFADPAADGGRSIIFEKGVVYVGGGQFWRQDASGAASGPF